VNGPSTVVKVPSTGGIGPFTAVDASFPPVIVPFTRGSGSKKGQAAKLCGKSRVDFLLSLPRVGVSMSNLRPEDAEAEVRFLRRA
jgi:hypothetical protein